MYQILESFVATPASPADPLAPVGVGQEAAVYLYIANTDGAAATCQVVLAGETTASVFELAAAEVWKMGPVRGDHIEDLGILGAGGDVTITPVPAPMPVSNTDIARSGATAPEIGGRSSYNPTDVDPLPFVWEQVV